jgi:hypothetical protein
MSASTISPATISLDSISDVHISSINSPEHPNDDSQVELSGQTSNVTAIMKTIEKVLLQKEINLTQVTKELAALRLVAPLLREEKDGFIETAEPTPTPTLMFPVTSSWWKAWRRRANLLLAVPFIKGHP